jgi:hypothetical protein
MKLVAFDPGGTTGWCAMEFDSNEITEWDCGELTGNEIHQVDQAIPMMADNQIVVCEDFQLRTLSAELSPVRVTAMLIWASQRAIAPRKTIYLQMPALAKSTVTDERLKRWGFWERGSAHARDATRHAITFMRRMRSDPALYHDVMQKIKELGKE